MTNVIEFSRGIHPDDEPARIDAYGQLMLVGIFSDLCRHRDSEAEQSRARELDAIAKRLGKLIERYEPQPGA